jgi:hypothetical protein
MKFEYFAIDSEYRAAYPEFIDVRNLESNGDWNEVALLAECKY